MDDTFLSEIRLRIRIARTYPGKSWDAFLGALSFVHMQWKPEQIEKSVDFLYEVGMLAKTPRSGFSFLGSGQQSVAEHLCRTAYVGYVLASMAEADIQKTVMMCLLHDLTEARTSDLNYVHQRYVRADEHSACIAMLSGQAFADEMTSMLDEYHDRVSRESVLAKDADNIEWLLSLREQADLGNLRARAWIEHVLKRLKTDEGQALARQIMTTVPDHWYAAPEDPWWVHRGGGQDTHNP